MCSVFIHFDYLYNVCNISYLFVPLYFFVLLLVINFLYFLYRWLFTCLQWAWFFFSWLVLVCDIDTGDKDEISMVSKHLIL